MDRIRVAYGSVSRFFYYLINQVTGAGDVPVAPTPSSDADGRSRKPPGRAGEGENRTDATPSR